MSFTLSDLHHLSLESGTESTGTHFRLRADSGIARLHLRRNGVPSTLSIAVSPWAARLEGLELSHEGGKVELRHHEPPYVHVDISQEGALTIQFTPAGLAALPEQGTLQLVDFFR